MNVRQLVDVDTLATAGVIIAAVALGFVFGVEVTGRLATASLITETDMLRSNIVGMAWIKQTQRVRWYAVGVFGAASVASTALWVYAEESE